MFVLLGLFFPKCQLELTCLLADRRNKYLYVRVLTDSISFNRIEAYFLSRNYLFQY